MAEFMIAFLVCNLPISGAIFLLLAARRVFKKSLSCRMRYGLWFLLLGLLAVPLLGLLPASIFPAELPFPDLSSILSLLAGRKNPFSAKAETAWGENSAAVTEGDWMQDFALSVSSRTPSALGWILGAVWIAGILIMALWMFRSFLRLRTLRRSALPLRNLQIRRLYEKCLKETGITKAVPLYGAAFLQSPMLAGLIRPGIYLPLYLLPDCEIPSPHGTLGESDETCPLKYMLLHELQHYRHRDILASHLMNLALIVYWFNPLIWYAREKMWEDRETACDDAVLQMLDKDDRQKYGHTLIDFAQILSRTSFPFAAGLGSSKRQLGERILRIASYERPTCREKLKSAVAFVLTAVILLASVPLVSLRACDTSRYPRTALSGHILPVDLSAYFEGLEGTFVLYDSRSDSWQIYNEEIAFTRTAPNSTYKIYDALLGLEEGVITPEASRIPWNRETYPFAAWNQDHTLCSAMQSSVNWYFQTLDERLGHSRVEKYWKTIDYGNETIGGSISDYWMDFSLKISPVEQVQLLRKLQENRFGFAPKNIRAIKDALRLPHDGTGTLYGKTGTGQEDGQNVNGWFVGFLELEDGACFFAAYIQADENAAGSRAAKIALAITDALLA